MQTNPVTLVPLTEDDREQFIRDNQWAFKYGAMIEFGLRDDHMKEDDEIISRQTIEESIDAPNCETYRIMLDGKKVGGVVLTIDHKTSYGSLDLLFIDPAEHSKGIGYSAWRAVEALHPKTKVWETCTPYFEKRNIHFYVNRCGFQIVEFYNSRHPDPHGAPDGKSEDGEDEMFLFRKVMRPAEDRAVLSESSRNHRKGE